MKRIISCTIVLVFFLVILGSVVVGYHDQPPLNPSTELEEYVKPGNIGVNFYLEPRFITRGYILRSDDDICVGDVLSVEGSSLSGEWFDKGGPRDTPPVLWVDDLDAVKEQINEGTFSTETYVSYICFGPHRWYFYPTPGP